MSVRNLTWHNLNETRAYPLDDAATCVSDGGVPLPPDVLCDLSLRYPRSYGEYPFLSSAVVTGNLVTLTVQCSSTPEGSAFVPLAALSVPRRLFQRYRQVPLAPQQPGVAGWAALGGGAVGAPYSGRFSTPAQARLAPRAARPYPDPPVPSLGRYGSAGMTGVVRLSGQAPVRTYSDLRDVGGRARRVVVFTLDEAAGVAPAESALAKLAGPCGGRPEAGTCGDPQPVQRVNGVAPDCGGLLTVALSGCAYVTPYASGHGVALDCDLGLSDACPGGRLPGPDGRLPGETDGYVAYLPPTPPPPAETCGPAEDPWVTCWPGPALGDFEVASGAWTPHAAGDPFALCGDGGSPGGLSTNTAAGVAQRNVALWKNSTRPLCKYAYAQLRLAASSASSRHNGGLVLNYSSDSYLTVELDFDAQALLFRRCKGGSFTTLHAEPLSAVVLDGWYQLQASVQPAPEYGSVTVTGRVTSVAGAPGLDVTSGPHVFAGYGPAVGKFGIQAVRSAADFSYFLVGGP